MRKLTALTALALAGLALAAAPGASARGGGDAVVKRGSCTGSTTWKLKAKLDDGRIETEFEVDQNRVGRRWRVVVRRNGAVALRTIRTTVAPSGSFTVRRRLGNAPGRDRIVAT